MIDAPSARPPDTGGKPEHQSRHVRSPDLASAAHAVVFDLDRPPLACSGISAHAERQKRMAGGRVPARSLEFYGARVSVGRNAIVRVYKIKRPGGVFWFDLQQVAEDGDGSWLLGPIGSRWGAPHDCGSLSVPVLVLLAMDRPWVAWWVGDPADQRLEIDVCRPPEVSDAGWQYVDLELDPVLHERDLRVEIEDWSEYDEACRNGWMSTDDAALAYATAQRCADMLQRHAEPWMRRGWQMLRRMA